MSEEQVTQEMIEKTLQKLQHGGVTNAPVLGVNMIRTMRGNNGGFPHEMYHPKLLPVMVVNIPQETAMADEGYVPFYIRQEWPQHWYRRNMDKKFETPNDRANSVGENIEARLVKTPEALQALKAGKPPKGCGLWCFKTTDIDPMPEESDENPAELIARLKGQLEEAQRNADKPKNTKAA